MQKHLKPAVQSAVLLAVSLSAACAQKAPLPVHFSHPELIRYDGQAFTVRGEDLYLYSGAFHYFRCPPELWDDRLDKIKAAGFNTVETYVPWNFHEPVKGHVDLSQLDQFLTKCERHGLLVIIRPGPYICAEWDVGGLPRWLPNEHPGFRTDSEANIHWSQYWYDRVLPVIRRHSITHGGSVILMQLENEYDFSGLPAEVETTYIKALYDSALKNGIDIPLITCWTRVARDKSDPVMSQILDASNFYPGWGIDGTLGSIDAMKRQEPDSPPTVTELQGGWFSDVGQSAIRRPEEYGADQINALTKFVMAHGVSASSFYMLYGGTNFGYWGSKGRTTSYDYTAPITEPGGLWEKYRAVKLIGDFVRLFGAPFVRMREIPDGAKTAAPGVQVLLRSRESPGGEGQQAVLFVRNTTGTALKAEISLPGLPGTAPLTVPLGARDARFLPLGLSSNGVRIQRSNLEVAEVEKIGNTPLPLFYGDPGDISAITVNSASLAGAITQEDQLIRTPAAAVMVVTRGRAARAVTVPIGDQHALVVSDSYRITTHAAGPATRLDVESLPGLNHFTYVSARPLRVVKVDGMTVRVPSVAQGGVNVAKFSLQIPSPPALTKPISKLLVRSDEEGAPFSGQAVPIAADGLFATLDSVGLYDSGYSVYEGEMNVPAPGAPGAKAPGVEFLFHDTDWHQVFIDGTAAPAATGNGSSSIIEGLAPGKHKLRVIYENEGRPNIGFMEQVKGLAAIRLAAEGEGLSGWKLAPAASARPGDSPPEAQVGYDDANWKPVIIGHGPQSYFERGHISAWLRTHIVLTADDLKKKNLRLSFEGVDDNAIVFLNGKRIIRHRGWDQPFQAPISDAVHEGDNVLAVLVENVEGPGGIYKPVRLESGGAAAQIARLRVRGGLNGQSAGWQRPDLDDHSWATAAAGTAADAAGIDWYRGSFRIPDVQGWDVPWALELKGTGVAQIWLNGKLLGRYFPQGPQSRYYLPSSWLNKPRMPNSLVLVVRPAGDGKTVPGIQSASLVPYLEDTTRVTRLEIGY